jgi:thiosulfate sulfurtransferase
MFKQISCSEAQVFMAAESMVVVDVRDIDSYEEGHIKGAIHLSIPALQDFCETADKTKSVIVYCYHGISSQSVAQHLVDQGFEMVYSLIGGFEAWRTHQSASSDEIS